MDRVIGEKDELKVRKKIKFRTQATQSRVKLQSPGVNFPTIGALSILAVYGFVVMAGGVHANMSWYTDFGVSWQILSEGKFWGLATHSMLHGNWVHAVLNALLFYYASSRVGHILQMRKVMILFLISAALAALVHSVVQGLFPGFSQLPLVGASGGVMGLLLAQTELFPDSRMILFRVSGRNMGRGVLVSSFLLFLLNPGLGLPTLSTLGSFIDQLFPGGIFSIGHLYHFIGGLAGVLLVGRMLPPIMTLEQLQLERAQREGETA